MPIYMKLGEVPRKRHIKMPRDPHTSFRGEAIAYEHVVTTAGFDRAYSIMYHLRPPTRVRNTEAAGAVELKPAEGQALRHHHLKTFEMPRGGSAITGRVPIMFNEDCVALRCRPAEQQSTLYRNGGADEVIYIHAGNGVLESPYGKLPYKALDYIVIPRGTTYRLLADDIAREDHLILESVGPVRLPKRYLNPDGQLMLGAPFYERDFHGPCELVPVDKEEDTVVMVKDGQRITKVTMASHPFDVVGWGGVIYSYTFYAIDF